MNLANYNTLLDLLLSFQITSQYNSLDLLLIVLIMDLLLSMLMID